MGNVSTQGLAGTRFFPSWVLIVASVGSLLQTVVAVTALDNATLPWACSALQSGRHGCFPTSWVIGTQKSGTTSLATMLTSKEGPFSVCPAAVPTGKPEWYSKETHYIENLWAEAKYKWNYKVYDKSKIDGFMELFPAESRAQCWNGFLEATPQLQYSDVASVLYSWFSGANLATLPRFVVVVREPVSRDFSSYRHQRHLNASWVPACSAVEHQTYESYAECNMASYYQAKSDKPDLVDFGKADGSYYGLWAGMYDAQLSLWVKHFDRRQFFIIEMTALVRGAVDTVQRLGSFLRLTADPAIVGGVPFPHVVSPGDLLHHTNVRKAIVCKTRDGLERIFQPWNEKLFRRMKEDQEFGRAPIEEPPFPESFESALCVHS